MVSLRMNEKTCYLKGAFTSLLRTDWEKSKCTKIQFNFKFNRVLANKDFWTPSSLLFKKSVHEICIISCQFLNEGGGRGELGGPKVSKNILNVSSGFAFLSSIRKGLQDIYIK